MNFCERCRKEPIPWKTNLLRNHCQMTSCLFFSQCQRIKYQSATPGSLASVARWFSSYSIIFKYPLESKLWVAAIQNKLLIAHSFPIIQPRQLLLSPIYFMKTFIGTCGKILSVLVLTISFINCKDNLFQINIFDFFQAWDRFLIYIISFGSLLSKTLSKGNVLWNNK